MKPYNGTAGHNWKYSRAKKHSPFSRSFQKRTPTTKNKQENKQYNHLPASRIHLCPKVNFPANENSVKKLRTVNHVHSTNYATY